MILKVIAKYFLLFTLAIGLFACSEGGGSPDVPVGGESPDAPVEQKTSIIIDLNAISISDADLLDYKLVTANDSVEASSKAVSVDKNQRDLIGLVDAGGQPYLLGAKHSGDESADLSLASTSAVMVLLNPRFNGVTSKDSKELENRIKAHSLFGELSTSIQNAINFENPCPLDPKCNFKMAKTAAIIANEIDVSGLYEGEN